MNTTECPNRETLYGYLTGTIPESEAESVAVHVAGCAECEQTLQALEELSDSIISALRQPVPHELYLEEPECRDVLQRLRSLEMVRPEPEVAKTESLEPKPRRRIRRLGDYELLKKLGQGGMGTVFQARHTKLKRIVALKVLAKERLASEEAVARFEREMEAVGRLDHPNIVRAMDAREVNKVRFLVMEYVDGLDLSQVVRRCGPLGIPDACEVIRQAADGLQCSHENGLIHRDVKPSNLMLAATGEVKLLDLGLAHVQDAEALGGAITGTGQIMGTPDYLSPEQALESHEVDIRTDVYSLGCTLYHFLAGRAPFSGPHYATPGQKVAGHLRDAVPPLGLVRADVPRPIAGLLERMLAKNAAERPTSPSEVANLLAPFCEGSKLIGLLREARRAGPAPEAEQASRLDTAALHVGSVETSREEAGEPEEASEPQAAGNFGPYHRRLGSPMRIAAMVGGFWRRCCWAS